MGKAVRSLFRTLLRLSLKFDQNPAAKLLFYRKTVVVQDVDAAIATSSTSAAIYYRDAILPLLFKDDQAAKLFHPRNQGRVNMYRLVRQEFRKQYGIYADTDRVDAAFAAVRKLSSLWKCYSSSVAVVGRSQQEASCAIPLLNKSTDLVDITETASLLPGILMIAHPMIQGPLKRAVILLLEHNTTGSYGVVINRPLNHTLASAVKNLPLQILDGFGKNSVSFGGMVRRLQYLHDCPQVAGLAVPLCRGPFYAGGKITEATRLVKENPALAASFHFFVGCCTWDAEELAQELKNGYWLPVHTQADDIVAMARKGRAVAGEVGGLRMQQQRGGRGAEAIAPSHSGGHIDLWSFLISRLGNSYRGALSLPTWIDASAVESLDTHT